MKTLLALCIVVAVGAGCGNDYDGGAYEGEWRYGKPHGQGTLKWPDGRTYVGHWKQGMRHGHWALSESGGVLQGAGIGPGAGGVREGACGHR
jgi:hypothetical protein